MGKRKTNITEYKNFWLIWLSSASKKDGISLFEIQKNWGITTNYLYHAEAGLGKPLYVYMAKDGYISKSGRKLASAFNWVSTYVQATYATRSATSWFPTTFLKVRWPAVQDFLEKNSEALFDPQNLRILYKGNKDLLGEQGRHIFTDIFLYVLFTNIAVLTKKYHADIVMKILSTFISVFSDRDILNYMKAIHPKVATNVPVIVANESELRRVMYPYNW